MQAINSSFDNQTVLACITEIWNYAPNSNSVYTAYSTDLALQSRGEGVTLLINKKYPSRLISKWNRGLICCQTVLQSKLNLLAFGIYINPIDKMSLVNEYIDHIAKTISSFKAQAILVLGDFNNTQQQFYNALSVGRMMFIHSPQSRNQFRQGRILTGNLDAIISSIPILPIKEIKNSLSDHYLITAEIEIMPEVEIKKYTSKSLIFASASKVPHINWPEEPFNKFNEIKQKSIKIPILSTIKKLG